MDIKLWFSPDEMDISFGQVTKPVLPVFVDFVYRVEVGIPSEGILTVKYV